MRARSGLLAAAVAFLDSAGPPGACDMGARTVRRGAERRAGAERARRVAGTGEWRAGREAKCRGGRGGLGVSVGQRGEECERRNAASYAQRHSRRIACVGSSYSVCACSSHSALIVSAHALARSSLTLGKAIEDEVETASLLALVDDVVAVDEDDALEHRGHRS